MKQVINLSAIAVLLTVVFSACTIQKRHYLPGYHVEWKKHLGTTPGGAASDVQLAAEASEEITEETFTELRSETTVMSEWATEEQAIVSETEPTEQDGVFKSPVTENTSTAVPAPAIEKNSKSALKQLRKNEPDMDHTLRIVLAVVCLFFGFYPLSVYFMEGIGKNFFINLGLTLLFILCVILAVILIASYVSSTTMSMPVAAILLILLGIFAAFAALIHAIIVIVRNV